MLRISGARAAAKPEYRPSVGEGLAASYPAAPHEEPPMPFFAMRKPRLPTPEEALPGRATPLRVPRAHAVNGNPIAPPFPEGLELATFGMGCFWGAEQKFWQTPGVFSTAVGYAGGHTPNPSYEE